MVRSRIEDLGRIAEMTDAVLEHDLFDSRHTGRNKDFPEWFEAQTSDARHDILTGYVYGVEAVRDLVYEIRDVARGEDELNRPDEDI